METRRLPVKHNETLAAVVSELLTGRNYIWNGNFTRGALTVSDLLAHLDHNEIAAVLRINCETGKADDITEYAARVYLYDRDAAGVGIKLHDSHAFPLFVRNSVAWANWKDDLEATQRVERQRAEGHVYA